MPTRPATDPPRPTTPMLGWLRGRLAKRFALLAGGAVGAQAVTLLAVPFLTRVYSPADLGVLAVFLAFCSVALTGLTLQYEQAIPIAETDREAARLAMLAVGLALALSCTGAGLMLAGASLLPYEWREWSPVRYAPLLGVCCFFMAVHSTALYARIRTQRYAAIARARTSQALGRSIVELTLGLLALKPAGLVIGFTLGHLVAALMLAWEFLPRLRRAAGDVSPTELVASAQKHAVFPRYATPSATLNSVAGAIPLFVLPLIYGPAAAGVFFVADRLTMWPVGLAGSSIGKVFYGEMASAPHDSARHLKIFKCLSVGLLAAGGLGAVVLFSAPWWTATLLGESWGMAGWMMAAVAPLMAARLVAAPLEQAHHLHNTQRVHLRLEAVRLVATAAAFGVGWLFGLPLLATVLVFSLAAGATYFAHWLAVSRVIRRSAHEADHQPVEPCSVAA